MVADEHLTRILRLLQGAIRAAGHTQTQVDERIGRRRGYLSHVFQRRVDLKLHDLLGALEVLEVEPRAFFHAAFSGRGGEQPPLGDLVKLVSEPKRQDFPPPGSTQPPAAPVTSATATAPQPAGGSLAEEELVERIRAIVHDLLTSTGSLPRFRAQRPS
jgi:hypothetical protein